MHTYKNVFIFIIINFDWAEKKLFSTIGRTSIFFKAHIRTLEEREGHRSIDEISKLWLYGVFEDQNSRIHSPAGLRSSSESVKSTAVMNADVRIQGLVTNYAKKAAELGIRIHDHYI